MLERTKSQVKSFIFFPLWVFFHMFFITVSAVCVLHVFFYQTETAKEQEYFLVVGSRKKRI